MHTTVAPGINWVKLNQAEVAYAWHKLLPFIDRALEHGQGELTSQDIFTLALQEMAYIWAVCDGPKLYGVCVTEIAQYLQYRVCRVVLLSGEDFEHWKHLEAVLERWAADAGCNYIEALTRPGLAKKMYPDGYRHVYCVIRKTVSRGVH